MGLLPRCQSQSMIPKSGYRFSEKIMLHEYGPAAGGTAILT